MRLIRGLQNLRPMLTGSVVTIGNFDAMHLGHQKIMNQVITKSKALGVPSVVIIFEPQPQEYFVPDKAPPRLLRLREKLDAFRSQGIDYVLCLAFNAALASQSADEFVRNLLVEKLHVRSLIVGDDFRFGNKRQGDFEFLQRAASQYNFEVTNTHSVLLDGERVSSSRVREALKIGDFATARRLLGYPYCMSGHVIQGAMRGRQLGFPTANIQVGRLHMPMQGVYIVQVHGLGDAPLAGAANLGRRPTVDGTSLLLEVHLLDFHATIYGRLLKVEFLHKIRDEIKFESLEALKNQIAKDVEETKKWFQLKTA